MHGGDPLARAGDVLVLVPQLPSAAPEQDQGLRDLRPLEPTRLMPVGRTGVRGGIWVTYSDILQLVLAESPEVPPNVHVGLSTAGVSVRDHTSTKDTLRVEIRNIGLMFSCLTRAPCICLISPAQSHGYVNMPQAPASMLRYKDPARYTVPMHGVLHVHMQQRSVARYAD